MNVLVDAPRLVQPGVIWPLRSRFVVIILSDSTVF